MGRTERKICLISNRLMKQPLQIRIITSMFAGKPEPTNDLELLRQYNPLSEREKLITGIFDRRLRQLAKLDTKQQILSECQRILIEKVLDYMNQLDAADIKYLQQTQTYTQRILAKEDTITRLQKTLDVTQGDLRLRVQEIERLSKELASSKLKITHLESENEGLLVQQKKDSEILENNKKQIKQIQQNNFILDNRNSILEDETEFLNEQLQERVDEINNLTKQIKSEGMKFWNQSCSKEEEIETVKRKLAKEIASKEREISHLQKKVEDLGCTRSTLSGGLSDIRKRQLSSYKVEDIVVREPRGKTPIRSNNYITIPGSNSQSASIHRKSRGLQSHHFETLMTPKLQILQSTKPPKDRGNFITISSMNNSNPNRTFTPRKRSSKEQKHGIREDDKDKLGQFKKECVNTYSELYQLSMDIKKVADERITLYLTQKLEVEQLLAERPSREQDIFRIRSLMEENQTLIAKYKQSQERAEGAYEAMRICKQQLKRRIDSTPLQIVNTSQPKGLLKQPQSSHLNLNGYHQPNRPQRPDTPTVRRVNSISKAASSESLTAKRRLKRPTDHLKDESRESDCIKEIIGHKNLNLNKYIKRSNSSFSLTRDDMRKDLRSAMH